MRELTVAEIQQVSGGNAQDTVTGSYVTSGAPAEEAGLGNVPWFGLAGAIGMTLIRMIF